MWCKLNFKVFKFGKLYILVFILSVAIRKTYLIDLKQALKTYLIVKRPGVAGAVLETPPLLIDSLSHSVILCKNVFKTPSLSNRKS